MITSLGKTATDQYTVTDDGFSLRSFPEYRLAKEWADRNHISDHVIHYNGKPIVKLTFEELGDALW